MTDGCTGCDPNQKQSKFERYDFYNSKRIMLA